MTAGVLERRIRCPFCDAPQSILLDLSAGAQDYIEDCQVCCQPMQIGFEPIGDDDVILSVDCAG